MSQKSILSFFKGQGQGSISQTVKDIIREVMNRVNKEIEEIELKKSSKNKKLRKHSGSKVQNQTEKDWLRKFPWLDIRLKGDKKALFCTYCTKSGKTNSFTEGSTNIQMNGIMRHQGITDHKLSESANLLKRKADTAVDELSDSQSDDELDILGQKEKLSASTSDKILFRTLFYCAAEEMPSTKVNSLIELQTLNGVPCEYKNLSFDTRKDILDCVTESLSKDFKEQLSKSEFYGIMMDESEDLGTEKKLCICIRFAYFHSSFATMSTPEPRSS